MPDPKRLKIYIDLDGVLADFDKAYEAVVGVPKERWLKEDAFWLPIVRTKRFWLDIPKMRDADQLWAFVRRHHYVSVLSSPGTLDLARATVQKRLWVKEHLGEDVNVVLKAAKEKQHYACSNSVLIDDWHKNVKRWKDAGGIGILHSTASETIENLVALGVGR